MKKGIGVVRTHLALSACLLLAALALTGGGVYAVLAGNALDGGSGGSSAQAEKSASISGSPSSTMNPAWREIVVANGIPTWENAHDRVVAAQAEVASLSPVETREDAPSVAPVSMPVCAVDPDRVQQMFPGLPATPETQALLDGIAEVSVSVTAASVGGANDIVGEPDGNAQKSAEDPAPDIETLDLAADFQVFFGYASSEGCTDAALYDMNGYGLDGSHTEVIEPNGIPDLAELMLVQQLLADAQNPNNAHAVAQWEIIWRLFPTEPDPINPNIAAEDYPAIQRVIAGYCMVGDTVSVQFALVVGGLAGWIPSQENLPKIFGPMPWQLSAVGDIDGDGYCNAVEWAAAKKFLEDQSEPPTTAAIYPLWQGILDPDKGDTQPVTRTLTRTFSGPAIQPYAVPQQYLDGAQITVFAIPPEPWVLDHWEVTPPIQDADLNDPVLPVVMNVDRTVHAVFKIEDDAEITCADPRLMQAIRVAIGKLTGTVYYLDVKDLTALDASCMGIENLHGIQQLDNLTSLSLYGNNISSISELSTMTDLQWLLLGGNRIGTGTPGLTNPIAALVDMVALEFLDLGWGFTAFSNNLAEAPTTGNQVTDIGPLENMNSLRGLDLSGNNVKWLGPLANKSSIQFLLLDKNPLWSLWSGVSPADPNTGFAPIGTMSSLVALSLQDTGLGYRTPDVPAIFGTTTGNLPLLQLLVLSENPDLTSLAGLENCPLLEAMICGNNPGLENISALSGLSGLKNVLLENTAITNLDPFTGGSFQDGVLTLRKNSGLLSAPGYSVCDQVHAIEYPYSQSPALKGNIVDRDFACGGEKLLTLSVMPALDAGEAGAIEPFVGSRPFSIGAIIPIRAVQTNPAYAFSHWVGDVADPTNPDTAVYMGVNRSIQAVFSQGGDYSLTILPPVAEIRDASGNTVTIDAPATLLPGVGTWACLPGELRQVQVTPSPGWGLLRWTDENGAPVGTDTSFTVQVLGKHTYRAVLAPAKWTLFMQGQWGNGQVTPELGCRYYYPDRQQVRLHAEPDSGSQFVEWLMGPAVTGQEAFSPVSPETTLTMDRDYTVWTRFGGFTDLVSLQLSVRGFGYTEPSAGTHFYKQGDPFIIRATGYGKWRFMQWEEAGQEPNTEVEREFTASVDRTIQAHFECPFTLDDFQLWLNELSPLDNEDACVDASVSSIGSYHIPATPSVPWDNVNGHVMPDVVLFAMLHLCLDDDGAHIPAQATTAYWTNLSIWYAYMNDLVAENAGAAQPFAFPPAEQIRTYAAYCTLSESMQSLALAHFKRTHTVDTSTVDDPEGFVAVDKLSLDGDADGDGFSNMDEWLYVNWCTQFPLRDAQTWELADGDPLTRFLQGLVLGVVGGYPTSSSFVPNFVGLPSGPAPDTVQLIISASPTLSGITSPYPSTYSLPVCRLSGWWAPMADPPSLEPGAWTNYAVNPVPPEGTCAPVQITLRAAGTTDWSFRRWEGSTIKGNDTQYSTYSTPAITVTLDADTDWIIQTAVFSHQPGISEYSKVEALRRFLVWRGYLDGAADVCQSTFDTGGSQSLDNPNLFAGNGIPDVAEFALLDAVFFDEYPGDTLGDNPGIIKTYAARAFRENRELAVAALSGLPAAPDWLADVVAGYMTLGGLGYDAMIRREVTTGLGRGLLPLEQEYDASQYRFLGARKDADGDGVSNRKEWDHVADDVNIASADKVDAFVDWALRADDEHTPPPPPPTQPPVTDSSQLPPCWNDTLNTHWPAARISRTTNKDSGDDDSLDFTVRVKRGPDDDGVEIAPANFDDIPIPAGRIIELEVNEADVTAKGFYKWDIPGTTADGSNEKKVQFTWAPPGEYPEDGAPDPISLDVYAEPWPRGFMLECCDSVVFDSEPGFCGVNCDNYGGPHALFDPNSVHLGTYCDVWRPSTAPITVNISGQHAELGCDSVAYSDQGFNTSYANIPFGCTVTVSVDQGCDWPGSGSSYSLGLYPGLECDEDSGRYSSFNTLSKEITFRAPSSGDLHVLVQRNGFERSPTYASTSTIPKAVNGLVFNPEYNNGSQWIWSCHGIFNRLPVDVVASAQYTRILSPRPCFAYADPDVGYYVSGWEGGSGAPKASEGVLEIKANGGLAQWCNEINSIPTPCVEESPTPDINVLAENISVETQSLVAANTAAACGSVEQSPGGKFVKPGSYVKLSAKPNCPYAFRRWEGTGVVYLAQGKNAVRLDDIGATAKDDPKYRGPVTQSTVYIRFDKGQKSRVINAYFTDQADCGTDGLAGVNMTKTALKAEPAMADNEIKAIAYVESRWTQYTCGRMPNRNQTSTATGLMQIMLSSHKTYCPEETLKWDEKGNLGYGREYFCVDMPGRPVSRMTFASTFLEKAPPGDPITYTDDRYKAPKNVRTMPRSEALLLEAFARYKYYGTGYWEPFSNNEQDARWVVRLYEGTIYADEVLAVKKASCWDNNFTFETVAWDPNSKAFYETHKSEKALPECPECNCANTAPPQQ